MDTQLGSVLLYFILPVTLATRNTLQFHSMLPGEDLERYFGTRNSREVPEYEIVHPVHLNGSRHRRSVTSHKPPLKYHVTALGEEYHLTLNHNDDLIVPDCLLTHMDKHGKADISPCPLRDDDCYYLGTSSRHNNSIAALSTCHGLKGVISTDSHQLLIQPIKSEHVAHFNRKNSAHAPHLVYKLANRKSRTCALQNTANQIISSTPRRVRRQTDKMYIEMLLVADKTMHGYHGNDLVNFMLTAANVAAGRYLDSSLGVPIHLSVVRLQVLQDDVPGLNIVSDADKSLVSFCEWQEQFNPFSDSDPLHVDAASLMTRIDLVHKKVKDTTGLASLGGMCIRTMRCSVLEDNGLDIGVTLAHETGHSLDMNHDGDGNFCDDKTNIMSTGGAGGTTAFKWSSCSRDSLRDFIYNGHTGCLNDRPTAQTYRLPKDLPGVIYSGDRQCELFLGQNSRICEETSLVKPYGGDECGRLVCFDPNLPGQCTGSQAPRMDGTECGKRKWCINGECRDIGSDGPAAQDGGWSAWDDHHSPCSRTCGGGVRARRRMCDNPRPLFGGKYCEGSDTMAMICNLEPCITSQFQYKEEQCAATDRFPVKGKLLHWLPGDTIGESVCMLFCHAEGEETIRLRGVGTNTMYMDGTECDYANGTYNRCVKGVCTAFGCDGVNDSPARPDVCGVCNGNSDTCVKKTGSQETGIPKKYVTFLTLPKGSTGIKMTNDNRFTWMSIRVSGKRMFNTNGLRRDRKDIYKRDGVKVLYAPYRPESLQIVGPIPVQIEAQVYRPYGDLYEDVQPLIAYEYYEPLHNNAHSAAVVPGVPDRVEYKWEAREGQCSVTCGQGSVPVEAVCVHVSDSHRVEMFRCDANLKPNTRSKTCVGQPCPGRWEVGVYGPCSKSCDGGLKSRSVHCVKTVSGENRVVSDRECPTNTRPAHAESCGTLKCPARWEVGVFGSCSRSCGGGVAYRSVHCVQFVRGQERLVSDRECSFITKPAETESCGTQKCTARWEAGVYESCSRSCDGGLKSRSVQCVRSVSGQDRVVSGGECPFDTKPKETESCGNQKCPGVWRAGPWSDCTHTCGEGTRKRVVTCFSPSNTECHVTEKPPVTESCHVTTCVVKHNKDRTVSVCEDDVSSKCGTYKKSACAEYKVWARKHCPKYCGVCPGDQTGATTLESDNATSGKDSTGQGSAIGKDSTGQGSAIGKDSTGQGSAIGKDSTGQGSAIGKDSTGQGSAIGKDSTGQGSVSDDSSGQRSNVVKVTSLNGDEKEAGAGSIGHVTSDHNSDAYGSTRTEESVNKLDVSEKSGSVIKTVLQNGADIRDTHGSTNAGSSDVVAAESFHPATTTVTPESDCRDVNKHCKEYDEGVCREYETWARRNCRRRCHFCGQEQTTLPATTTPSSVCKDISSQCEAYHKSVCVQYKPWAKINCRQFCEFCA